MVKARKYVMVKHFQGELKKSDIKIVEEELPALNDREFLCQAEYLSVDPFQRGLMPTLPEGSDLVCAQVARIIESKHPDYPKGKLVFGYFGARDYTIVNDNTPPLFTSYYLLPDFGKLPSSLALGTLGMPGNTAYFGFLEICKPKAGETVVISSAGGAVGSHVGQIAKIKGCKVIGFSGSDVKCKKLKEELGFDFVFNYKTVDVEKVLIEAAPQGVDCYFDNVGGELSDIVMKQMNQYGRISVCGAMSLYNKSGVPKIPTQQMTFILKELKMEGFMVTRWVSRWQEGIQQNLQWIKEGKLQYNETITHGFENLYEAFFGMLQGENYGKAIIQV